MLRRTETDELYEALVAELAHSLVPSTIMGLTIFSVGLCAYVIGDDPSILAATMIGAAAGGLKVALIGVHRRRQCGKGRFRPDVRTIEVLHAYVTCGVAVSVGALASKMFATSNMQLHLLATALLFGYCAGVVARLSVRPVIAATAITVAATPTFVSAALFGTSVDLIVAMTFMIFLVGAIETILHVYRTARGQIELRLEMASKARHDPLTGLLNRFGLRDAFEDVMRRQSGPIALHLFDLNDFKQINDTLGHAAGDRLLGELAGRLLPLAVEDIVVARIGGDEFVVVHAAPDGEDSAATLAKTIQALLTQPCIVAPGETRTVGISLGYTVAPAGTSLDDLIRAADQASYAAKRAGGGIRKGPMPVLAFEPGERVAG